MHRGRGGGAKGGRSVSHPGVSAAAKPSFVSPFQPPPGSVDLLAEAQPGTWHTAFVGGMAWRLKVPLPSALGLLSEIIDTVGGAQVKVINGFMIMHMHPGDLETMLCRMLDPEDPFGGEEFIELYRAAVTVGTARPFSLSSTSAELRPTGGGRFEPALLLPEWVSRLRL